MGAKPGLDLFRQFNKVFTVILHLSNRITNIIHRQVTTLFFYPGQHLGPPAPSQLFEGTDIQITVMNEGLKGWHGTG